MEEKEDEIYVQDVVKKMQPKKVSQNLGLYEDTASTKREKGWQGLGSASKEGKAKPLPKGQKIDNAQNALKVAQDLGKKIKKPAKKEENAEAQDDAE